MTRIRRAVLFVLVLVVATAAPAHAQTAEGIRSYDVQIDVAADGDLAVSEVIAYDFGDAQRHGIERFVPTRLRYDKRYDRVYRMTDVSVTADPGTPTHVERRTDGGNTVLRVGDPDRTISGLHTYTIRYRVQGALNHFADHDELYWNAIGHEWSVPIERAHVEVGMPAAVQRALCFAGPAGSTLPCTSAQPAGDRSWAFDQNGLGPFQGMTVVAGIPVGAVTPTPRPILDERWSADRAFSRTPATMTGAFGLLGLLLAGVVWLVWRNGRDRRFAGSAVDVAFGNETGAEQPVGLMENRDVPVEFVPPDGLRPGQIGTLVDEVANPLDVTATIVDLAVRGFLRIEEIPKEGWFGSADWRLVQTKPWDDPELQQYERTLLRHLFEDGQDVELSSLKNRFAAKLHEVQDALYDDAVGHGWFARRPDRVRQFWAVIGVLVLAAGIGLTVLAAIATHWALVPLPIAVAGVVLLIAAHWMPRRTARGTATLRRALGFRRFIDESEKDRAHFAERKNLFSEYLPYAVVFGATDKWARAFAGLDGQLPDTTGWYVGVHPFTMMTFGLAMNGFATTTAGTIASTPSGSGSSGFGGGGFSGGGGGGGGGGSW